jgi:hypothetical protein
MLAALRQLARSKRHCPEQKVMSLVAPVSFVAFESGAAALRAHVL